MTTCINCNTVFEGKYCNNCGQKNYTVKDKSIKHIAEEAFHFITHFEGTFFTTLKTLFTRPGKLTYDYCTGKRKPYFKPISFYLLIVVVYLFFPLFAGLNMKMSSYKGLNITGPAISKQINNKAAALHITEEQLAERFELKSHNTSKILLFLFIPFSAVFITLLYYRSKRMLFDHLILATEINIMYLLALFILFPVLYIILWYIFHFKELNDELLGLTLTTLFSLYVGLIFRFTYHSAWLRSIISGFIFGILHALFIMFIYKPLVFEATLALL